MNWNYEISQNNDMKVKIYNIKIQLRKWNFLIKLSHNCDIKSKQIWLFTIILTIYLISLTFCLINLTIKIWTLWFIKAWLFMWQKQVFTYFWIGNKDHSF